MKRKPQTQESKRRYLLRDKKRKDGGLHTASLCHPSKPVEQRGVSLDKAERHKASLESPNRVWGKTVLEPESVEIIPAWEYYGYPDPESEDE